MVFEKMEQYEYDMNLAPRKIRMLDISIDTKHFQNRKKPYNEYSVQNIISSIVKGDFVPALFNPIVLRKDTKAQKLYIISGHSRYEAFKRLNKEYADDLNVQKFLKKMGYMGTIPGLILEEKDFEEAKGIAMISNTLASTETDTERAEIYRYFRETGKAKGFIEMFGKTCEKGNWAKIKAYSYLCSSGITIEALERFEENNDENGILKRIGIWIGNARMKIPALSNLHEKELFEWLVVKGGYGTQNQQIHTYQSFLDKLEKHIQELQAKGGFEPDKILNIQKSEGLSLALQNYYLILEDIIQRKRIAYGEFHSLHRKINKILVEKNKDQEIEALKDRINCLLQKNLEYSGKLQKVEQVLFDTREFIEEENLEKIRKEFLDFIHRLDQEYYTHKGRKDSFISAAQRELSLDLSN